MTADQFRERRDALRLTQSQLAAALGMTRDAIAKMEAGERPVTVVTRLAIEHLTCRPRRRKAGGSSNPGGSRKGPDEL